MNPIQGVKMGLTKIAATNPRGALSIIKKLRSFLGFADFCRDFINNLTSISNSLYAITTKVSSFHWNKEHQDSFEALMRLFTTTSILKIQHEDRNTNQEKDASGQVTWDYLSQCDTDEKLYFVVYFSKKLTPVECNYNIHDKELLGIIRCLNE